MKKEDKAWYQGYACAAAIVAKLSCIANDGRQVLFEGGVTKEDLEEAEVDPSDIQTLFEGDENE